MQNALRFLMKKKDKKFLSSEQNLFFFIRNLREFLHLVFADNFKSEYEGNFKLDGTALRLHSALRFERLKIIHFFKNQGQFLIRWQCPWQFRFEGNAFLC